MDLLDDEQALFCSDLEEGLDLKYFEKKVLEIWREVGVALVLYFAQQ